MATQKLFNLKVKLLHNNTEVVRDLNESSIVFAEDLVIHLADVIGINPIGRHLFALYHTSNNLWLANNERFSDWRENREFELRLRFRPYSISKLKDIDAKAFVYYFYQIRQEFLNGKYDNEEVVYGLAVTDMLRELLEKDLPIDNGLALDFSKFIPAKCRKHKTYLLKNKIQKSLLIAWNNSNKNIEYVMQEYIESFLHKLMPDYGTERYKVTTFDSSNALNQIEVQYQPYNENGITIRSFPYNQNTWIPLKLDVTNLCFISIQTSNTTVEISRKNGIPLYFHFFTDLSMKSFVSLLDGYYRLSEKWSFDICKEISSPYLSKLKSMKCHGPVGLEFSYNKLKEKGNNKPGTYILRESMTQFNQFKLDVIVRKGYIKTVKIDFIDNKFIVEDGSEHKPFNSLSELINSFEIKDEVNNTQIALEFCFPLSEYDQPNNLLLCRPENEMQNKIQESQVNHPYVIPSHHLKHTNTEWIRNHKYCVRLAHFHDQNNVIKVVVKEIRDETRTNEFLKTFSKWTHLRNDSITLCKGISLCNPLSIVLEYLPFGPFDAFLIDHQLQLKVVDLIESVTYLSRALWYLQENQIIHGRIRCHNLIVSHYSSNSLRIKLSDPISNNDLSQDSIWLPPEYLSKNEMLPSFDVWSFGTTVWQIFNYGDKPNFGSVDEMNQPISCPEEVWLLIKECWNDDPALRKQPQSIVRDVSQILYEVYNSRRMVNNYANPIYNRKGNISNMIKSNINKFMKDRSVFGSTSSLSSSVTSAQSEVTFLTEPSLGTDYLIEPIETTDTQNQYHNDPLQSWVIEANQLKVGKLLGQGCYGEVMRAVLTQWAGLKEEVVAVKRIKSISGDGLRDMKREIEIMKKLNHKNIVEIKGFVEEPQIMLVMEFVLLGSLVTYLKANKPEWTSTPLPLIKFASDISNGMEYLESKSIVHRDLAARNILVASEDHVKISDFGLAQLIDPKDQYYRIKTHRELPLRWYAPESLKYGRFTHKSDIWSFGIILWEMYSFGENPVYPDIPDSQLVEALESDIRLRCPDDCPLQVYELMRNCWRLNLHDRPSFTEIRQAIEELAK